MQHKAKQQLYFSSILKENSYYSHEFEQIMSILDRYGIEPKFLNQTKDIWCRDYLPIQKPDGSLVQFRFEPHYLKKKGKYRSIPKEVLQANGINATFSKINIDGGNVVNFGKKAIITERVFEENNDWEGTQNELISQLEEDLDMEVILIPSLSRDEDMTGHSDGYVRFVNDKTALVSSLEKPVQKRLTQKGFNCIEMPCFQTSNTESAFGIYVNYLELADVILFPVFKGYNKENQRAISVVSKAFSNKIIEPIEMYNVANYGGLMNCISWTYSKI